MIAVGTLVRERGGERRRGVVRELLWSIKIVHLCGFPQLRLLVEFDASRCLAEVVDVEAVEVIEPEVGAETAPRST